MKHSHWRCLHVCLSSLVSGLCPEFPKRDNWVCEQQSMSVTLIHNLYSCSAPTTWTGSHDTYRAIYLYNCHTLFTHINNPRTGTKCKLLLFPSYRLQNDCQLFIQQICSKWGYSPFADHLGEKDIHFREV